MTPTSQITLENKVALLLTCWRCLRRLIRRWDRLRVTNEINLVPVFSLVSSGSVKRFPMRRMRSTLTIWQKTVQRPRPRGAHHYIRKPSQTAPSPALATMTCPLQWVKYCGLTPNVACKEQIKFKKSLQVKVASGNVFDKISHGILWLRHLSSLSPSLNSQQRNLQTAYQTVSCWLCL